MKVLLQKLEPCPQDCPEGTTIYANRTPPTDFGEAGLLFQSFRFQHLQQQVCPLDLCPGSEFLRESLGNFAHQRVLSRNQLAGVRAGMDEIPNWARRSLPPERSAAGNVSPTV